MSRWHLDRAIFLLGLEGPNTRGHRSPKTALRDLVDRVRWENEEDPAAAPYPGTWALDYVAIYRGAGL